MIKAINGHKPELAKGVFLAPGAHVIGKVKIGRGSSVWFNAVIRGDEDIIEIGEDTNIQDNCTVHVDDGCPVSIGNRVTVGHNVVLHGCTVEDEALVGMGAIVLNNAKIGRGAVVGAGSVVTSGTQIPPNTLAIGTPAKVIRELPEGEDPNPQHKNYSRLTADYLKNSQD